MRLRTLGPPLSRLSRQLPSGFTCPCACACSVTAVTVRPPVRSAGGALALVRSHLACTGACAASRRRLRLSNLLALAPLTCQRLRHIAAWALAPLQMRWRSRLSYVGACVLLAPLHRHLCLILPVIGTFPPGSVLGRPPRASTRAEPAPSNHCCLTWSHARAHTTRLSALGVVVGSAQAPDAAC